MLKTPKEILEEIKKWSEEFRVVFSDHLNYVSAEKEKKESYKENYILSQRQKLSQQRKEDPEFLERVRKVLTWIEEAIKKDEIVGWRKLYENWNGDPDISKDKYNEKQEILGGPYDLRNSLEEWEWSVQQQEQQELIKKLQNLLQTAGINPDDENVQKQVEGLKQIQTDLTDLGIDKSKVKETIENERNKRKAKDEWLSEILAVNNYSEESVWEEIKTEARNKRISKNYTINIYDRSTTVVNR